MRWMTPLLLLTIAACGCGGNDRPCQPRHGLYRYHLEPANSSTCPPLPDTVFNADARGAPGSACAGGSSESPNMCDVTIDLRCVQPGGALVVTRGKVTWSEDGSGGSGTIYFELWSTPGVLDCAGTYSANYSRL